MFPVVNRYSKGRKCIGGGLMENANRRGTRRPANKYGHARENIAGYLFLAPCLIGFVVFIVFPMIASLYLSFTKWDFLTGLKGIEFIGLDNFKSLLGGTDNWFNDSMKHTLIYAAVSVPLGIGIGMIIAVMINKYVYCSGIFKVLVFIPYVSSIVASAVVWQVVFHPSYGPINSALMAMGMENPPRWFIDMTWAFPLVIVFQIWQGIGYNVIVFSSGLKSIPPDLYEAATIDGANELQKFRNVTIPMISPTTFFLSTMGIIGSFKVFDAIRVLTNGGPGSSTSVIAFYIYREAFTFYRMGTANAAAWIMFFIIFLITMIQLRGQKKWVNYD